MAHKRKGGTNALPVITNNSRIVGTDICARPPRPDTPPVAIDASAVFFSGRAAFARATFSGGAVFRGARFDSLAYFKEARFFDRLILSSILIKSSADFRNVYIRQLDVHNAASPIMIARILPGFM